MDAPVEAVAELEPERDLPAASRRAPGRSEPRVAESSEMLAARDRPAEPRADRTNPWLRRAAGGRARLRGGERDGDGERGERGAHGRAILRATRRRQPDRPGRGEPPRTCYSTFMPGSPAEHGLARGAGLVEARADRLRRRGLQRRRGRSSPPPRSRASPSTNRSSVSFDSVSVGSIMSAPCDDEREVDRRRVEAVVDEPLRDVHRVTPVAFWSLSSKTTSCSESVSYGRL